MHGHFMHIGQNMCGIWSGGTWPGFFGLFFHLLFWGLLITALVGLVRFLWTKSRPGANDTALETLRQRFAAGEIDQQEFEEAKKTLSA